MRLYETLAQATHGQGVALVVLALAGLGLASKTGVLRPFTPLVSGLLWLFDRRYQTLKEEVWYGGPVYGGVDWRGRPIGFSRLESFLGWLTDPWHPFRVLVPGFLLWLLPIYLAFRYFGAPYWLPNALIGALVGLLLLLYGSWRAYGSIQFRTSPTSTPAPPQPQRREDEEAA